MARRKQMKSGNGISGSLSRVLHRRTDSLANLTLIVGNCRVEPMGMDQKVDHVAVIGCRRFSHPCAPALDNRAAIGRDVSGGKEAAEAM
jgi:hypothetical protein